MSNIYTKNGVSAKLNFYEKCKNPLAKWELVLKSGENYASIDGIFNEITNCLKFNDQEGKVEFHKTDNTVYWKLLFGNEDGWALEEGHVNEKSEPHKEYNILSDDICTCLKCANEFNHFITIAKTMGVKIPILCPYRCFNDYMAFKSDIPDITERITQYLCNDWNKDSVFNLQISWMKSICKKYHIDFEIDYMPDFFKWVKGSYDCTYDSMDTFIKTLTPVPELPDEYHKKFIETLLIQTQNSIGRKEKAICATIIYDYMAEKALNFLKKSPLLMDIAIKKSYELKSDGNDLPDLMKSINNFLKTIGAPLNDPNKNYEDDECPYCESNYYDSNYYDSDDEYVDTWSKWIDDPYWGDKYYRKGGPCDQEKELSKLMQDIFKNEKITFIPKVMEMYHDWEKFAPKTNNYQKIMAFIANGHTFIEPDIHKTSDIVDLSKE